MTILSVVQNACRRMNLTVPSVVVTSTEQTPKQLYGLAGQAALAMARRGTWQALHREHTFTTVAAAVQTASVPDDYDWFIEGTAFNRTLRRPLTGPLSPSEWQQTKATLIVMVNPAFRIRANSFELTPNPAAGQTCAYEYMSKNFCLSAAEVEQDAWAADTDTFVLDEELLTLDLMWRFKEAKGLPYDEDFRTAEEQIVKALARDGAKPRISTSPPETFRHPRAPSIPDTLNI